MKSQKLRKYATTNFPLTGTLRKGTVGTVIKKTSMPFKNVGDYNADADQIQLKYDGVDVVFTGTLIESFGLPPKR